MSRAMYTIASFCDHWVAGAVSYGRGFAMIRKERCVVRGDSFYRTFHIRNHSFWLLRPRQCSVSHAWSPATVRNQTQSGS